MLFPSYIYAEINIKRTENIVGGELAFPVVIRMQYRTCPGIELGIVPYYAETSHTVYVQIVEIKITQKEIFVPMQLTGRFL